MRALVLAGSRLGPRDPVAQACGVSHKCLVPVDGMPMLQRVLAVLAGHDAIDSITVSVETPEIVAALPGPAVDWHQSRSGPSASVADVLQSNGPPLLVTTADHALLTPGMIDNFLGAISPATDVAVALVSRSVIEARFPAARRTYLRFRDDGFSGANLFCLRTAASARAVDFWKQVERDRKRPWRIARALGPGLLIGYALRRYEMRDAVRRAGRAMGVDAEAIALPIAEAAVDIDKLSDLTLANAIASERRQAA